MRFFGRSAAAPAGASLGKTEERRGFFAGAGRCLATRKTNRIECGAKQLAYSVTAYL
jgi:hypothetical protein